MWDRNYLLSITEFLEGKNSARLLEEAFCKVDSERRSKAERMRTDRGKAACLGAGLLLQLAVREAEGDCGSAGYREVPEKGVPEENHKEGVLPQQRMAEGSRGEGALPEKGVPEEDCYSQGTQQLQKMAECSHNKSELQTQEMAEDNGQRQAAQEAERGLHRYSVSQLLERISYPIPLAYQYGKNGKPYFRDYPFYFNLSHSGEYVFCVLSLSEVGADIQQQSNKDNERLAERFFSAQEIAALKGCKEEKDALFYQLWTRKEAYGKLTGEGIASTMGINFLPGAEQMVDGRKLVWEEYSEIAGYKLAICRYAAHL